MKNVIIIGASGNIARKVTEFLFEAEDLRLTLFLRNKNRLNVKLPEQCRIIEGNVLDYIALKAAISDQDIVYVNLAGDLEPMIINIVQAMKEQGLKKIIFISSIGIYDSPLKPVLKPYRKAADVIEASGLEYTILRPAWFTQTDEIDYETTLKGTPEKGTIIAQKSLAALIAKIIESPEAYIRKNLGVNKPNS